MDLMSAEKFRKEEWAILVREFAPIDMVLEDLIYLLEEICVGFIKTDTELAKLKYEPNAIGVASSYLMAPNIIEGTGNCEGIRFPHQTLLKDLEELIRDYEVLLCKGGISVEADETWPSDDKYLRDMLYPQHMEKQASFNLYPLHMEKQASFNLYEHMEKPKPRICGSVLLVIFTLLTTASFQAAFHPISTNQPEKSLFSNPLMLFISLFFIASVAILVSLLHEFPFQPWPQVTVLAMFASYMFAVKAESPDEAVLLFLISILMLLLVAAAGNPYGFPRKWLHKQMNI